MPRRSGRWRSMIAKHLYTSLLVSLPVFEATKDLEECLGFPLHADLCTPLSLLSTNTQTVTSSITFRLLPSSFNSLSRRVPTKATYRSHDTFEQSDWRDAELRRWNRNFSYSSVSRRSPTLPDDGWFTKRRSRRDATLAPAS